MDTLRRNHPGLGMHTPISYLLLSSKLLLCALAYLTGSTRALAHEPIRLVYLDKQIPVVGSSRQYSWAIALEVDTNSPTGFRVPGSCKEATDTMLRMLPPSFWAMATMATKNAAISASTARIETEREAYYDELQRVIDGQANSQGAFVDEFLRYVHRAWGLHLGPAPNGPRRLAADCLRANKTGSGNIVDGVFLSAVRTRAEEHQQVRARP